MDTTVYLGDRYSAVYTREKVMSGRRVETGSIVWFRGSKNELTFSWESDLLTRQVNCQTPSNMTERS